MENVKKWLFSVAVKKVITRAIPWLVGIIGTYVAKMNAMSNQTGVTVAVDDVALVAGISSLLALAQNLAKVKFNLKWLVIPMAFLFCSSTVKADDTLFSFKGVDFKIPLAKAEVVYLYDVLGKQGLAGVETPVISYKGFDGSIGAITDADLNGSPFIGVRHFVPVGVFSKEFHFGLWVGRNFNENKYQGGIKATIPLW